MEQRLRVRGTVICQRYFQRLCFHGKVSRYKTHSENKATATVTPYKISSLTMIQQLDLQSVRFFI